MAQQGTIHNLEPQEFKIALDSCTNEVILDIRPDSFTGKFKIEGAIVATNRSKLKTILDTLDYDMPLFFYCVEGMRSKNASKIALEKGFRHIFNLKKGVNHYKKRGYPVVDVIN